MPANLEAAKTAFIHKYRGHFGIVNVRGSFDNEPQVLHVSTLRRAAEVETKVPATYYGFPVKVEQVPRETEASWLKLSPQCIRDARSGKTVKRGERCSYSDGSWWRWLKHKYADDMAWLWIESDYLPNGAWQPCYTWWGGLVWVMPS